MLLTQLQSRMGCHGHHAILCNPNRFIFVDNIIWHLVVPLNNFASMNDCLLVQGKSTMHPLPNTYSMILPQFLVSLIFMTMQM